MAKRAPSHIVAVVGTRPEAIKLAPVVIALRKHASDFRVTLLATGQHREMLAHALSSFGLTADMDLGVMTPSQTLAGLTSVLLTECQRAFEALRPDFVLVQGDTTTVLASTLAAFYAHIPVGHVEAGLRTGDLNNPFPEEMNRRAVATLASLHFCPTNRASRELRREGVSSDRIEVTGNTIVDALELIAHGRAPISTAVQSFVASNRDRVILVTCHRRESFGPDLAAIVDGVAQLARTHPERAIFFPVHLNPAVRDQVLPALSGIPNIHLSDPVNYSDLLHVLQHAELVVTDSGGIQEEAPSFGVPVLVVRRVTERPEGVTAGFAKVVAADVDAIVKQASVWLRQNRKQRLLGRPNPYGDGQASQRIANRLLRELR